MFCLNFPVELREKIYIKKNSFTEIDKRCIIQT